jgi:hypothetical protein
LLVGWLLECRLLECRLLERLGRLGLGDGANRLGELGGLGMGGLGMSGRPDRLRAGGVQGL